jgi:hypothetical protein
VGEESWCDNKGVIKGVIIKMCDVEIGLAATSVTERGAGLT